MMDAIRVFVPPLDLINQDGWHMIDILAPEGPSPHHWDANNRWWDFGCCTPEQTATAGWRYISPMIQLTDDNATVLLIAKAIWKADPQNMATDDWNAARLAAASKMKEAHAVLAALRARL